MLLSVRLIAASWVLSTLYQYWVSGHEDTAIPGHGCSSWTGVQMFKNTHSGSFTLLPASPFHKSMPYQALHLCACPPACSA